MSCEILIDGYNVFMRHFVANPSVSLNNQQCGGILGFLRNIKHLCDRFQPNNIIVIWEGGGSARRRAIDPNYKHGRRPVKLNRNYYEAYDTEDNRDIQLKVLIEILNLITVSQIYLNDCEADDVIGYICKNRKAGHRKIIVSSDKDYYQLIDDDVTIWSPNQKRIIDKDFVLEKWGISADNFCTARCFIGDQSDGIKGTKGAGFKTMIKNFNSLTKDSFVSVNDIIEEAKTLVDNGKKSKVLKEIVNSETEAKKNWKLMYLDAACLSWNQVKSINYQYEHNKKKVNKLDLMRVMIREGLNNFDVNDFLISVNATQRH